MEKVYRLLPWLNSEQAIDWLQYLTQTPLTYLDLLRLCDAELCDVYLDEESYAGEMVFCEDDMSTSRTNVIGTRIARVNFPLHLVDDSVGGVLVTGSVYVVATQQNFENCDYWLYKAERRLLPQFKPSDIQALAAKMNGEATEIVEVEELRSQLEHERASRKQAEAELFKRRAEDGSNNLEKMRLMLNHDHAEFSAMQRRAENAEMLAVATDRQLAELSERNQSNTLLIAKLTERLGQHQESEPSSAQTEMTTTGLTFPYATKHLEAMRDAALKYWADHTSDKRQPTQVEIQWELCGLLGLSAPTDKSPPQKAIYLASAIKPDDLPKS